LYTFLFLAQYLRLGGWHEVEIPSQVAIALVTGPFCGPVRGGNVHLVGTIDFYPSVGGFAIFFFLAKYLRSVGGDPESSSQCTRHGSVCGPVHWDNVHRLGGNTVFTQCMGRFCTTFFFL
jgi:hypothetical protein